MTGEDTFLPCTPYGIIEMMKEAGITIEGKHAVVIGRSNIVGKPVGQLLLREHATVTYCHSRTANLSAITRQADLLIVAIGRAKLVKAADVKPGAVVIDVGMNREDGKLCGDVDFDEVSEVASFITPVPGGVGPMTITMLLENTILSAQKSLVGALDMASQTIFTVSELTRYIKGLYEGDPLLQHVWIRGEISNFNHHSRGHMYFTIKDAKSRIQSVMFASQNRYLAFKPENGMNVLVRGEVNVYEPYGQYQFYAQEMQPDGIGSLYLAYEKLKGLLEQEGLFSEERKKPIPRFPQSIAVITSPTGAAVRDMMSTLKRRYPIAERTLLPVLVQGEEASRSIAKAITQANLAAKFDVILLGRGGGSIEELWPFNAEEVARAIAGPSYRLFQRSVTKQIIRLATLLLI